MAVRMYHFLNDNYDKSIYGVNQIINSIFTYADKYLKDYTLIYVPIMVR